MKTPWKIGMLTRFIQRLETLQIAYRFLFKITGVYLLGVCEW